MLRRALIVCGALLGGLGLSACGGGGGTTSSSTGTTSATSTTSTTSSSTTGTGGGSTSTTGTGGESAGGGGSGGQGGAGPVCGDGTVAAPEACDDGNTQGGDGCDADCHEEKGFDCSGAPSVCAPVCGDGIVAGKEGCDDGNAAPGDGCDAACAVETGFACMGSPSLCDTVCGDGIKAGFEACDDGNATSNDGCSATCTPEKGFSCVGSPSVCDTVCGDGIKAGLEACDDGDAMGGDGCSAACAVEAGYKCAGAPSVCAPVCGDGVIIAPEECDDGNLMSADGCTSACVITPGYSCAGQPSVCAGTCGDGIVAPPETCDDGNLVGGDGCSAGCAIQMGYVCNGNPSACATVCGDGIKAGAEACDDGNANGNDGCSAACAVEPGFTCAGVPSACATICGDGVKKGAEACDDGNVNNNDCCTSACQLLCEVQPNNTAAQALPGGTFVSTLVLKGAINPAGDVDYYPINLSATRTDLLIQTYDGNGPNNCVSVDTVLQLIDADGVTVLASNDDISGANSCSRIDPASEPAARSLSPGVYYARVAAFSPAVTIAAYTVRFTLVAVCGNNVVEGSEECDGAGGAPCDANCQRVPVCGDGFVDAPEGCDDQNMQGGDGCAACAVEVGFVCVGNPSACSPVCGDGVMSGGEQCDDGNTAIGDGCDSACRTEVVTAESESNNTTALADTKPALGGPSSAVTGSIGAIGDKDIFKLTVAANSIVRLETFGPSGDDCPAPIATTLKLLSAAGVQLYSDSGRGIGACSALEVVVAAGTYYVQVEEAGNNATIAAYRLEVKVQTSKGNEVEPNNSLGTPTTLAGNDVFIFGGHQAQGDQDFYAIVVPAGYGLRAEVIEGGAETCESSGIDSYLELYDVDANLLAADEDGGRGFCSAIDGTGLAAFYPAAGNLPAGTYYLNVRASPNAASQAAAQFDYRLALTVR
jgi:cysteine-rich repeat protein